MNEFFLPYFSRCSWLLCKFKGMMHRSISAVGHPFSNYTMTYVLLQVDHYRFLPYEPSVFPHGQTTVSH
jgi:hypothetical protein